MQIKFSHAYPKLIRADMGKPIYIEHAELLEVIKVDMAQMSERFLRVDAYTGKKGEYYPLPRSGSYLMLIFLKLPTDDLLGMNMFTTLRRWTASKEEFYRKERGRVFEVVIEGIGNHHACLPDYLFNAPRDLRGGSRVTVHADVGREVDRAD